LLSTLVPAGVLSLVVILTPLRFYRASPAPSADRWRVAIYFLTIGFAFLFVEIAAIQRFILFLGHPIYAIAVVLCGFLVFAGVGSGFSPQLQPGSRRDTLARQPRAGGAKCSFASAPSS
jgi:hypothetical protein